MRHKEPGITFLSVACFPAEPKPAADTSVVGDAHREAWAGVDPDALSRFEGEGGPEAPEPATPRRTLNRNHESNYLTNETEH
jgi:hypothetical protein